MNILKETTEDGFTLLLRNGTVINNAEWVDISEQKRVIYQDGTKTVNICKYDVQSIIIKHGELQTNVDIPAEYQCYYAIRAQKTLIMAEDRDAILGRVVGLVKGDEVVEERFLNAYEGHVQGWKK